MRICRKCKVEKSDEMFSKNKAKKDGIHDCCKQCHTAYLKDHYARNKQYYVVKARQSKLRQLRLNRDFLNDYLSTHPCVDCGEADPIVLEFDHVRGVKSHAVSILATSLFAPIARIEEEIAKCDVRCANCHRRRTAQTRGYWKIAEMPPDVEYLP